MIIEEIIHLAKDLDPSLKSFEIDSLDKLTSFNNKETLEDFNHLLSQWILADKLPEQLNVYNNFGQPPVTLFNNGKFVIDLYFWLYSDTSIHTHSFKGAFKVLYGESQQEIFHIEKKRDYLEDVRFNQFTVTEKKTLLQSQCQMITQGDDFCHRVIHLASPTVTLCIRTINDQKTPQWHQFENGLSILKKEIPESIYKSMFYFQYLIGQNQKLAKSFIKQLISNSSASLTVNLFEDVLSGSLGLEDQALELFQNAVLKKYEKGEWFKLYLDECS